MKTRMGFIVTAAVFLFAWTTADLQAAPRVDFNKIFNECPESDCGAPPSGGEGGGGGPLIVAYTWGPVFSVQEDIDADGHNDPADNCDWTPNDPSMNADGDDYGDACDLCPNTPSVLNGNKDADLEKADWEASTGRKLEELEYEELQAVMREILIGDECDPDMDGDGVPNELDNCPEDRNPDQKNSDSTSISDPGDACDDDSDNDGIPNDIDNCITDENPDQANIDAMFEADKQGDLCDDDYDNDGLAEDNGEDLCPNLQSPLTEDTDNDNIPDPCDNCPRDANPDQLDTNGNGKGDVCDV